MNDARAQSKLGELHQSSASFIKAIQVLHRVGQNRTYSPYMTVHWMKPLPRMLIPHRYIYIYGPGQPYCCSIPLFCSCCSYKGWAPCCCTNWACCCCCCCCCCFCERAASFLLSPRRRATSEPIRLEELPSLSLPSLCVFLCFVLSGVCVCVRVCLCVCVF